MNPRQFLTVGGIVLVLVGILGFIGMFGPTADDSLFGASWWFDNAENWAHLVLGIVAIAAVYVLPANLQKPLVAIVGILAILVAVYNLFGEQLLGANLQIPYDLLLHLVVGIWALVSAFGSGSKSMVA